MRRRLSNRRRHACFAILTLAVVVVAGCSSGSGSSSSPKPNGTSGSTGTSQNSGAYGTLPAESTSTVTGGTITYPIVSGSTPTYIMPIYPVADYTVYTSQFQIPMYRPLYWTTTGDRPGINYPLSLAAAPVYSNHDKTVTINMRHNYTWSQGGAPVDAKDIIFFIDITKAAVKENASNFGPYSKGDFPDNIVSAKAAGTYKLVLKLTKAYNPTWFLQTQLTDITPMPSTSWAKASANGPQLDYSNPTNAKAIYDFLNGASKQLSTYATNPLWQDVDGPFKLSAFNTTTDANTMVPNPSYGGPQKPTFDKLEAVYYASDTAEFTALLAGQLNQGYVPLEDLPRVASLKDAGYNVFGYPDLGFSYVVFNFKDTTDNWDKVISQLYVRQALAHLSDQDAIIKGAFNEAGATAYGPVPALPATPYVPSNAATNPYPYSPSTAASILKAHGWTVVPNGTTTCTSPGTGAGQCGAGIPKGQNLNFTDYYASGTSIEEDETQQLASAGALVGIKVTPVAKTFNFIVDQYDDPVTPSNNNKWAVENYGGFTFTAYPTTDTIFNTHGEDNEGDYSSPEADKLINASKFSSNPDAVQNEASYLTKNLPGIWLPNPDAVMAWKGVTGTPDSFSNLTQYSFTPEYWHLTSSN